MRPKFRKFYEKSLYPEVEKLDGKHCVKYDGNYRLSVQEQVDRFIFYGHNLEASRKKPLQPLDPSLTSPSKAYSPLEDPFADIIDRSNYVAEADKYLKNKSDKGNIKKDPPASENSSVTEEVTEKDKK